MAMVFRAKVSRRLRRQNWRQNPEGEEADSAISQMRRPATEFVENSLEYWNSLASHNMDGPLN